MAQIAPLGRYRAFDADGNPLAGGKLFTYEAGTSTPKATFTDQGGGTANSNPVILDADGYADVWLDVGGYKFSLFDANDVLQWTVDDIDGGAAAGFASQVVSRSSSFSLSINDQNVVNVCTAPLTVSLLPAATAGDGFASIIINLSSGNVTIDPDGSETINNAVSYVVNSGNSAIITTNGVSWYTFGTMVDFSDNLFRVSDGTDSSKKLAFELSGITAGQTRTLTLTDTSLTIPANATNPSSLILAEDTDNGANTVQIIAPAAITSNRVLTLPDETGTVVTTARAASETQTGVVELATLPEVQAGVSTSLGVSPANMQAGKIVYGTAITPSGTAVNFTGIPSWASRVTMLLSGVSTNGTSNLIFRLGDSGGVEATGYNGATGLQGTGVTTTANTTGAQITINTFDATTSVHGKIEAMKLTGNTWVITGSAGYNNGGPIFITQYLAYSKALSDVLDRVQLTTVGGADTFDAGTVNVSWE